jgi:(1->4)-alpha-D-glucan 1-alpha-D-glucosylmutase
LQLGPDLSLDDAATLVPYLASLGVSHVYLSPILRAAPGSTHGYDVVDHDLVAPELGGRAALDRLSAAAHAAGLGLVLDVVPNHMAVPTPAYHNRALWSVLAEGADSRYAHWFDVDWSAGQGALLMPVLGRRIGAVLASGELVLDEVRVPDPDGGAGEPQTVLRYHDHVFPVRAGTESLPLTELVAAQHYRLAYWRVADEELNYRRFFDVGTLAAIRVEDPDVFDRTHALILELVRDGVVDGLRIDHPDGLADPRGYLERLAEASGQAWVVAEKILAPDERLPADWPCAGTTGYDALWRIQGAFVDPAGAAGLAAVMHRLTGDLADGLPALVETSKRQVVAGSLYAEVHRLSQLAAEICGADVRLRDHTRRALEDCLVELLVAADRYRYYVVPGRQVDPESLAGFEAAVEVARGRLDPDRHDTLAVLAELLLGRESGSAGRTREARRDELVVRFQQTCGAVMAKGVEDTAFYRWTHLVGLCEVGGAPERFAVPPEELHAWLTEAQRRTPLAMTTLSTHDTKRGEDTRARLVVLSGAATEWATLVGELRERTAALRPTLLDGRTEQVVWQTLAGTWLGGEPLAADRLAGYLTKVVREAKEHTSWTDPDEGYEAAALGWAEAVRSDPAVREALAGWERLTAPGVRAVTLGQKLVQLTAPGVPDVYQGEEVVSPTLVDPDNRRPVDHGPVATALEALDSGAAPRTLDEEKLLVTSRALRLRHDAPEAFTGAEAGVEPIAATTGHALAFARTAAGEPAVVTVTTRLTLGLERLGGWGQHTVVVPDGHWVDVLTGRAWQGGAVPLADLLATLPVALLVREREL